ncbi:MAG: DUF6599 family protein [Candidatus Acidiferrales bacterium]
MRVHILILLAFLLLAAIPASAQGILPNSFVGWIASDKSELKSPAIYGDDRAGRYFSGAAGAALKEYGLAAGEQATYTREANVIQVALYRMNDLTGAYGEYSYLRSQSMPRANLTDHSAMSHEHGVALVGNLVVEIRGHDLDKIEPDLKALVAAVTPRAQQGLLPSLWQHLPTEGFVDRSDHYILGPDTLNQFLPGMQGDWLGFSQGAEAELATYLVQGNTATLLLADFPTPQAATKKLAELEQKYNVNAKSSGNAENAYAKRSLTLLAIVWGARSQSEADEFLNKIHSGTEVTWNEPGFSLMEPGIGPMIVGAIIGTGVICLFALISGIAFGGVRLVVKRFLPDKVFDRSSQMQVLQLGLSSKPINAEDFYGLGESSRK